MRSAFLRYLRRIDRRGLRWWNLAVSLLLLWAALASSASAGDRIGIAMFGCCALAFAGLQFLARHVYRDEQPQNALGPHNPV